MLSNSCFYGVAINSWGVRWLILSLLPSIFIVHGILFWPFILCAPKKIRTKIQITAKCRNSQERFAFKSALNRKDGVAKRKYNVPKMHMFHSVELNSFIDSTIKLTESNNGHLQ